MIPIENGTRLMFHDLHCNPFGRTHVDHIAYCRPSEVMSQHTRTTALRASCLPHILKILGAFTLVASSQVREKVRDNLPRFALYPPHPFDLCSQ